MNIVATYGRSLYALVIGLFCGRWTLMALGEVNYGLMGVVGGLTAFIGFFFVFFLVRSGLCDRVTIVSICRVCQ